MSESSFLYNYWLIVLASIMVITGRSCPQTKFSSGQVSLNVLDFGQELFGTSNFCLLNFGNFGVTKVKIFPSWDNFLFKLGKTHNYLPYSLFKPSLFV